MIYSIGKDFYVKVGNKYFLVDVSADAKGDVSVTPARNKVKIEATKDLKVVPLDVKSDKERILGVKGRSSFTRDEDRDNR